MYNNDTTALKFLKIFITYQGIAQSSLDWGGVEEDKE
jgi:hypothetical protein